MNNKKKRAPTEEQRLKNKVDSQRRRNRQLASPAFDEDLRARNRAYKQKSRAKQKAQLDATMSNPPPPNTPSSSGFQMPTSNLQLPPGIATMQVPTAAQQNGFYSPQPTRRMPRVSQMTQAEFLDFRGEQLQMRSERRHQSQLAEEQRFNTMERHYNVLEGQHVTMNHRRHQAEDQERLELDDFLRDAANYHFGPGDGEVDIDVMEWDESAPVSPIRLFSNTNAGQEYPSQQGSQNGYPAQQGNRNGDPFFHQVPPQGPPAHPYNG